MNSFSQLCLRSLDISQASPFLEMAWDRIKREHPDSVLILQDQSRGESPCGKRSIDSILKVNEQNDADFHSILSWSIPNERTIEDITLFPKIKSIPGPLNSVYKLSDKRATKILFEQFLLPTPKWEVLDREFTRGELLRNEVKEKIECNLLNHIPFPIVIKPLWDCMGHGVEIINNLNELVEVLSLNNKRTILAESFIDGDLGCVEIIGVPGCYFFQPPCLTGKSRDGVRSNFDTVRICHPNFFSRQLSASIKEKIVNVLECLDFSGACCVDFITTKDDIYFLEINPRISGISCLSSAASGVNSFEATYLISSNQWGGHIFENRKSNFSAIQIGGTHVEKYISLLESNNDLKIVRNNIISVDGNESRNVIVSGASVSIDDFLKFADLTP
ncbi:ATP-grasp domain-containing protein [Dickeya lacustris]|uniref:ATP-grasp domain-containing protein n=1 Tax=Dickeya lacustris TaxID=2259638 RepID=A0ABY8G3B5_9GAMM|nr:ATP-grasp domain-containing protein [Dickeya lacustris]WFN54441.1 ATP-grasp domain-containing protein [Dickeya lacustris]